MTPQRKARQWHIVVVVVLPAVAAGTGLAVFVLDALLCVVGGQCGPVVEAVRRLFGS